MSMIASTALRSGLQRLAAQHSIALGCFLIFAAYLLPGLTGRDPWKPDEPYVFGIVLNILNGADWIVPAVAGQPFLEKPPLYPLVAALSARGFSAVLPWHDGARLANLLFNAITLGAVAAAARRTWGAGSGWTGALILLACAGFIIDARMILPDIALLAGFALAFAGLLRAPAGGWTPALLLGTGAGAAFLAKGLIGPGLLAVSALAAFGLPELRSRRYAVVLLRALIIALPWVTLWPAALYARSPALFSDWFWQNNVGRFFGFSVATLGAAHSDGFWSLTLPWFLFPAWPLAAVYLFGERERPRPAEVKLSLVVTAVTVAVLGMSASAREIYALPLLPPVAVLAAGGAQRLRPGLDRALASTSALLFGAIAVCIVVAWMIYLVNPSWIPWLHEVLPGRPAPRWHVPAVTLLGILLLIAASAGTGGPPGRPVPLVVTAWVAGAALCLQVFFGLWTPWLDAAKSYRIPFGAMAEVLPLQSGGCVATRGVGESERAMLDYIAHVHPVPAEGDPPASCDFVLIQDRDRSSHVSPGRAWQIAWQGARPADSHECFTLYVRGAADALERREADPLDGDDDGAEEFRQTAANMRPPAPPPPRCGPARTRELEWGLTY